MVEYAQNGWESDKWVGIDKVLHLTVGFLIAGVLDFFGSGWMGILILTGIVGVLIEANQFAMTVDREKALNAPMVLKPVVRLLIWGTAGPQLPSYRDVVATVAGGLLWIFLGLI